MTRWCSACELKYCTQCGQKINSIVALLALKTGTVGQEERRIDKYTCADPLELGGAVVTGDHVWMRCGSHHSFGSRRRFCRPFAQKTGWLISSV
jgi:hypothetical protein